MLIVISVVLGLVILFLLLAEFWRIWRRYGTKLKGEKERENKGAEESSRLKAIFRMIPDLMFITDNQGQIVDYLAGNESDLFVPPHVFLNRPVSDILPPPTGQQAQQAISEALRSKRTVVIEYSLPMKEGDHYYQASITPAEQGQALIVVRNVTERKIAEKEIDSLRALLGKEPKYR